MARVPSNGQVQCMHRHLVSAVLLFAGLIALGIGGALAFAPAAFEASVGIDLAGDASALSETRGSGGGLLGLGLVVMLGAFVERFRVPALVLGAAAYLGYGGARALGLAVDGTPNDGLVMAMALEFAIGVVCVALLLRVGVRASRGTPA